MAPPNGDLDVPKITSPFSPVQLGENKPGFLAVCPPNQRTTQVTIILYIYSQKAIFRGFSMFVQYKLIIANLPWLGGQIVKTN